MKIFKIVFVIAVALVLGFLAGIVATEFLDKIIWPSLIVGIPVGIFVFIVSFVILKKKD
jgi:hypothetical protein